MTYAAPISPNVNFTLDAIYVAPIANALAFNLGVNEKDAAGILNATLENCVGAFIGNVPGKKIGVLNSTLDDCTGSILAAWLVKPMSLCASFTSRNTAAKPIQFAIQNHIETAQCLTINTDSSIQAAQKLARETRSKIETASVQARRILARSERAEAIRKSIKHTATDLHTYTHKFDNNLFKEPPAPYRYTPLGLFDFGIHLNEWTLSTTTDEYVAASIPLEFNLIDAVHVGLNDFDLSVSQTQPVTRTRQIFDNVSTYQPENQFFVAWANDTFALNHSYQRAGLRISASIQLDNSAKLAREIRFKLLNSIKLAVRFAAKLQNMNVLQRNHRIRSQAALKLSRRYREKLQTAKAIWNTPKKYGVIVEPPRPPLPPNPPHNPNNETFTIPTKTVYSMLNTITATLTDLTPLDVADISLSLDADSWAWQFGCKLLNENQLNLVTSTNDLPVEIIVTINGFAFHVLAEKITHTKTFAKDSIGITGRSLSALLSQPYELPRSATQSTLMTVQQLANLELPNGWTINWTAQTWNVTSGAFSYTAKTPMQVISEIAADIGASVIPSRIDKTLKIAPRYPVLPWQFDSATPNLIIPDSAIESVTYRAMIPAQANGVYVHGGEIGGVIGFCRLNATNGAKLAQTVNNNLMTDVIGCRALGERILAGQYTQPSLQSITLPMNATDMPLVNVGDLIRVNIDGGQVRGIVNSVSISANFGNVSQTVQIGEETANVWSAFKDILPRDPLLVGTLSSTDGQTSLMTLVDGGVIRVRGTGTANAKYYIRAGRIENEAPNLVLSEIVV